MSDGVNISNVRTFNADIYRIQIANGIVPRILFNFRLQQKGIM